MWFSSSSEPPLFLAVLAGMCAKLLQSLLLVPVCFFNKIIEV